MMITGGVEEVAQDVDGASVRACLQEALLSYRPTLSGDNIKADPNFG
jgi:hypothetical protein